MSSQIFLSSLLLILFLLSSSFYTKLDELTLIPGRVLSSDLKSGEVTSLQGDPIKVIVNPSKGVSVNDAQVTKADIPASNGVIHQIDNLILPPSM